jgi:hypothetical protein
MGQEHGKSKSEKRDSDPKPEALSTARLVFAGPLDPLGKDLARTFSHAPTVHPPLRPRNVGLCATYPTP